MDHMMDWQWSFVNGHGLVGIVFWTIIAIVIIALIKDILRY